MNTRPTPYKKTILLTGIIALCFNIFALYLQYVEDLQPCVNCIDIRVGLYGVTLFAFLTPLLDKIARAFIYPLYILMISTGAYTLYIASEAYRAKDSLFATCALEPAISAFIPVQEWFPAVFAVKGMCGEAFWNFMGLELEIVGLTTLGIGVMMLVALSPLVLGLVKK